MGPTASVEQALRTVGQPGQAGPVNLPGFDRAVAALTNEPVIAWGWSDTVSVAEATAVSSELQMKRSIEEIREFDPEFAAEMEKEMADEGGPFGDLDFALLRRYIGPSAWAVRSVEDGFVLRSYLLSAGPGE
jgi:hypothetical protein